MESNEPSSQSENSKRDRPGPSETSPDADGVENTSKKSRLNSSDVASCSTGETETNAHVETRTRRRSYRERLEESSSEDENPNNQNEMDMDDSGPLSVSNQSTDSDDIINVIESNRQGRFERRKENDAVVQMELKEIMNKPQPKYLWNPVKELKNRELGHRAHHMGPEIFKQKYWDSLFVPTTFKEYGKLEYHSGCVNCLGFDPTGRLLASGSDDLQIAVWDWSKKKKWISYNTGHRYNVFQCEFLGGSDAIVSCARDGQVRLADIAPCGTVTTRKLTKHSRSAHKLAVRADNANEILSSGQDGVVFHIDIREPKPHRLIVVRDENGQKVPLNSINSHPRLANQFCVAGQDEYVRVYDRRIMGVRSPAVLKYAPSELAQGKERSYITCAVYSHNGDAILASYTDQDIYLFDTERSDKDEPIHRYGGHRNSNTVKGVSFFSPSNRYIVSGSDCGNIFIWDRDSEAIVNCFCGDASGIVNVLEPHPTEPYLATSGLDDDVKIWEPCHCERTMAKDVESIVKNNLKKRIVDRNSTTFGIGASTLLAFFQDISRRNPGIPRAGGGDTDDDEEDYDEHGILHEYGGASDSDDSNSDSHDSWGEEPLPCTTS